MFGTSPASQRTTNLSGDHRNSLTTSIKFGYNGKNPGGVEKLLLRREDHGFDIA